MAEVTLTLNEKNHGAFFAKDGEQQLGEMVIGIKGKNMTVYHTEVIPDAEGKGISKKLLNEMAGYARKNALKVIPLCAYVFAQFRRHPNDYADIWKKNE